jgi:hypothetical protein
MSASESRGIVGAFTWHFPGRRRLRDRQGFDRSEATRRAASAW